MLCTFCEESHCSVIQANVVVVVSICMHESCAQMCRYGDQSQGERGGLFVHTDSVDTIGDARELLEIPKAFPMVKQSRSADFGALSPSAWREDTSQQ